MKKGLLKKILALVSAGIIACSVGITTAFAESTSPIADPDYVEITLEEFKEQYPDYEGIIDPREDISTFAVNSPGSINGKYPGPFTWEQVGTKWYLKSNGVRITTGGWYQDSTRKWYFLYPYGVTKYDKTTATGEMAAGWEQISGYWYYFNGGGVMQTDWYGISGKWYYLRTASIPGDGKPEGTMVTGEHFLNSAKGNSTKTINYYFSHLGEQQLWYYPLYAAPEVSRYFVTSPFANERYINGKLNIHNGLDLRAAIGVNIDSPCTGKIVFADYTSSMGNVVMIRSNTTAPNGNPVIVRIMHMSEISPIVGTEESNSPVIAGTYLGKTGNTGGVEAHFHIDMNAKNILNGSVTNLTGQNPAAFFTDISWNTSNWNPYGSNRIGYQS